MVLGLLLAQPLFGQTSTPEEIQKEIARLSSDSYRERVDAEEALRRVGASALPALEKSLEQTSDPDFQSRAAALIRAIRTHIPLRTAVAAFQKDPDSVKDLWFKISFGRKKGEGPQGYVHLSTSKVEKEGK